MHWSNVLLQIARETGVVAPPRLAAVLDEWHRDQPDAEFFDWAAENRLEESAATTLHERFNDSVFRCTLCHTLTHGRDLLMRDQLRCPRCHGASLLIAEEDSLSERDRRILAGENPDDVDRDMLDDNKIDSDDESMLATESDLRLTVSEQETLVADTSTVQLQGHWRVVALAGNGPLGRVWKVWHDVFDWYAAARTLEVCQLPEIQQRFRRGAVAWSRLEHPHIVRVIGFGDFGGNPAVLCEWLDGGSVEDLLEREERLRLDVALDIAAQAATGLGAAHDSGMVHCDLQPASLLWSTTGAVKVTGFSLGHVRDAIRRLAPGVQVQAPPCVPPEVARGEVHFGSDVWMLGAMLYRMVTGRDPLTVESGWYDPVTGSVSGNVPRLHKARPTIPDALDDFVSRMTLSDPEDRPSMHEVADTLRRLRSELEVDLRVTQIIRKPQTRFGEIEVLVLPRHPDGRTWLAVESTIDRLVDEGATRFIVDLTRCERLDNAGLAVLRFARDKMLGQLTLILAGVSRRLLIALQMLGVQEEFNLTSSVQSAVDRLGGGDLHYHNVVPADSA